MICLYLVVALFSCDLAQSQRYIEPSSYADELAGLSGGLDELVAITPEGIEYTGTMAEIERKMAYGLGQYVGFDDENFEFWKDSSCLHVPDDDAKETIFGADDRRLIYKPASVYPYSAMGMIERGCTGTFISPYVVLTAAHCVYHNGKYSSQLTFYREKTCFSGNYDTRHSWGRAFVPWRWRRNENNVNYDIAWIVYNSPSPVFMPYTSVMPAVGTQISIYGYPGDIKHECLWGSSGPLNGRTQRRLFFKVDACGGMSGSAVYYSDGGKDVIIGVLTIGTRVTNWGVRLTEEFTKTCDALNRVAIRNVARRRFG